MDARTALGRGRGRHRRRFTGLLAAAALLAAAGLSVGAARPATAAAADAPASADVDVDVDCVTGSIGCYPRMTFGVGTPQLPNSTTALTTFVTAVGRPPDMGLTFTSFRYVFNVTGLRDLARSGITPLITWEPWDPTVPDENRYPLRDIAAGLHDTYLLEQAARVRDIGAPVAIRFGHEMNAPWYPWGAGVHGNTPADYVAAYRHVHDLFAAQGVTDVTWVWAPAALDSAHPPDLAGFYPGDAYVDWSGLTAYFDQSTDTWATAVAPTLRRLDAVAPTKPFLLAETGVLPGPTRPAMMHDLLDNLLRTPRALGFAWFDFSSRQDWRIDDDPAALTALREVLSSGWYPVPGTTFTPPAPLGLTEPAVHGTVALGSTLTATAGTWRGASSTTGRWLLCDAAGSSCTPTGTAEPSLVLDADAVGRSVRFEVTATNAGGSTTSTSPPTATVGGVAVGDRIRAILPTAPAGTGQWRQALETAAPRHLRVATTQSTRTGHLDLAGRTPGPAAVTVTRARTLASTPTAARPASLTAAVGSTPTFRSTVTASTATRSETVPTCRLPTRPRFVVVGAWAGSAHRWRTAPSAGGVAILVPGRLASAQQEWAP